MRVGRAPMLDNFFKSLAMTKKHGGGCGALDPTMVVTDGDRQLKLHRRKQWGE